MVFELRERNVSIPWKDGAVIHFKMPLEIEKLAANEDYGFKVSKQRATQRMWTLLWHAITGWDGVVSKAGKIIEFNESSCAQLFDLLMEDAEMVERMLVAYQGVLPNSPAGMTQSTSAGTIPAPAGLASGTK